jgi:hypothetical protein
MRVVSCATGAAMEIVSRMTGTVKAIVSLATIRPLMERPHCELPWGVWRGERGVGSRHEDVCEGEINASWTRRRT